MRCPRRLRGTTPSTPTSPNPNPTGRPHPAIPYAPEEGTVTITDQIQPDEPTDEELARYAAEHPVDTDIEGEEGVQ